MTNPREDAVYYNALAILAGGNYARVRALLAQWGSPRKAWERAGAKGADPGREWERMTARGISLAFPDDPGFPPLLNEIASPPLALYYRGSLAPAASPTVAIVGTRRATPGGKESARAFAAELSRSGCAIVSGLAFGIDAAAHEGCLAVGGRALAVLGTDLDAITPRSNAALGEKIIANGGAVVSEYPLGAPVFLSNFIQRNRIVSGLSRGALLIEIPQRSGALSTARFAFEQNREVFVLPGPARHPNFEGSHELIRSGAELVTEPNQILETLGIARPGRATAQDDDLDADERAVVAALASAPGAASIDKIIELTNLNTRTASETVTFLLVKGKVREEGGAYTLA
jgi:DNA processing protein